MDGMTLLAQARDVGLTVTRDGDKLVIEGPPSAEAMAKKLIAHKPVVMLALEWEAGEWHEFVEKRGGRTLRVVQRTGEVVEPWHDGGLWCSIDEEGGT